MVLQVVLHVGVVHTLHGLGKGQPLGAMADPSPPPETYTQRQTRDDNGDAVYIAA
jgi:hypothetical protein